MADFGAPVANVPYNPNQGLNTLASIYGIKTAQAEAQQQQQTASQRYGIAQWMKGFDPSKHVSADGTIDLNAVLSDPSLRAAAGDAYPEVVSNFINMKQGQLQNKQTLSTLNNDVRTQFQTILGGLRTDPDVIKDTPDGRQKVQEAIGQFAASGPDASRIAQIYEPMLEHAPTGKMQQMLSNFQLQAMAAGGQAQAQAPGYVNTGTELKQTNPQAAGGDLSGGVTKTGNIPLPVGQVQNVTDQAKADQGAYSAVVSGGNEAPQMKNILQNIKLLAGQTITGPGSESLAKAETALSQFVPGMQGAADEATKRQLLGKYVEQLAMRVTQQNGYATDDARALVSHAIPDPNNMTPQAIQQAAKFIQTQTEVSQARAAFANNYVKTHGNSIGYQKADSEFMQNMDPRIFDYLQAGKGNYASWLSKNIPNKAEQKAFLDKIQKVNALGGFNYD